MTTKEFVETIYLGDRACKRVVIDSWNERLGIQVNCISRLRRGAKTWDYYTDEDVNDGWLVFSGLTSIAMTPSGPIPNDFLEIVWVRENTDSTSIDISVGSVNADGVTTEVTIALTAKDASIETNEEFIANLTTTKCE